MPSNSSLGWKIAWGVLAIVQTVLLGVAFRTYDAVDELKTAKTETAVVVSRVIIPRLDAVEIRVSSLEKR